MRRSLAILAVTAVCGGTVAVATAAYADDGDDSANEDSDRSPTEWLDGVGGSVTIDDSGPSVTCRLPDGMPKGPDLERLLPALPKPSDLPELLYSEQAVRDRDSGDVTYQVTQLGKVTDRSDDRLTVESSDGTAWTWELSDDTTVYAKGRESTASSLESGDRVLVHGTRDGDTRRAEHISDPAPEIGLGAHLAPPERLRDALPDNLRELPGLEKCEEEGTGAAA